MTHANSSRRDFLKQSLTLAPALWVAGNASGHAAESSPNETLNVGFIGVGGRGARNLAAVAKTESVAALCDVDSQRAAAAFEHYGSTPKYTDFRRMLDGENLDAVVVSTPDHTHAAIAIEAMQRGLHVYCEKPLAHSVYEARRMREVAADRNVVTQMGNQSHATGRLRSVVEMVRSGMIGPVREVLCWSPKDFRGKALPAQSPPVPETLDWELWLGPVPQQPYHEIYVPFEWRRYWAFGSGNFGDMACHIVDAPYWALELGYPERITTEGPSPHPEGAPAWLKVHYEFPARGEQPPVSLTWFDGEAAPPMKEVDGVELPAQGSLIIGEKGKILFPHTRGKVHVLPRDKFASVAPPKPQLPRPLDHHREWTEACKGRGETYSDFDYGGQLTEVIMAGIVAYRTGEELKWDGPNMKAIGSTSADRFIRPEFRDGSELG